LTSFDLTTLTPTISRTERDTLKILSPLNSTHQITYNYTLQQHLPPSHIGEKNTWEGIGVVSLTDLSDQWKVTMSPMIQKFFIYPNLRPTKKTVSKNTYPFGRSSDDRDTDTHNHTHTDRQADKQSVKTIHIGGLFFGQ
jgi:hypothetical protein